MFRQTAEADRQMGESRDRTPRPSWCASRASNVCGAAFVTAELDVAVERDSTDRLAPVATSERPSLATAPGGCRIKPVGFAVAGFALERAATSAANDSTGICQAEAPPPSLWPLSATTVLRADVASRAPGPPGRQQRCPGLCAELLHRTAGLHQDWIGSQQILLAGSCAAVQASKQAACGWGLGPDHRSSQPTLIFMAG